MTAHAPPVGFVNTLSAATLDELLMLVRELATYPEDRLFLAAAREELHKRLRQDAQRTGH